MPNHRRSAYNRRVNWISPEETEAANAREIAARRLLYGERVDEDGPAIETRFDEIRFAKELRGD